MTIVRFSTWALLVPLTLLFMVPENCLAAVSIECQKSVEVTTSDDSCVALTNINASVSEAKREVTFSFNYRVWNNYRTPITQLHIMRGGRVIATFYNGVPPKGSATSGGSSGSTSATVPVPSGAEYDIKLCMTLARTVEQGVAHAEQSGGHNRIFAKVKSD